MRNKMEEQNLVHVLLLKNMAIMNICFAKSHQKTEPGNLMADGFFMIHQRGNKWVLLMIVL